LFYGFFFLINYVFYYCILTYIRLYLFQNFKIYLANECGQEGMQRRMRTILAEAKYGGLDCPKDLKEDRKCLKECNY
jgi:hypothetical protein